MKIPKIFTKYGTTEHLSGWRKKHIRLLNHEEHEDGDGYNK